MTVGLRLALGQAPAALSGTAARLAWLDSILPDVADRADLLLLPELFACGYNISDAIVTRAETVDGPTAQAVAARARQYRTAIHYGFAETAPEGLFNAALCFGPDGMQLSHQRKLAIPPGFERGYFEAGQGCHLFDFHGLKIATLICYDAEFPETARHVTGLGAQLVLVPTALGSDWGWVANRMIPTRAYENGVYLAYANSAGTENGMQFLGCSVIASPDGQEAARAGADPEILFADIDPARVHVAQARLPYLTDRARLKF